MSDRVTMRDVAQAAGASTMTVSRALRDDASVSAETRRAVRETATRLGYVYDTTAQAFRAQRSGFVAVPLPSLNNANFATTHRSLARSLSDSGLQLLLGVTDYRIGEEERLVGQLLARRPEALVLTGGSHTDATCQAALALDIPVVEIWDKPAEPLGHGVGFSNADAMRLVVDHLAATGRRRIAFIGAEGEEDRRGLERRHGTVESARTLGLPEVEVLEGAGPAPVSMMEGARVIERLGPRLREFDALVCVSDPVAFGVLTAIRQQGLRVPEDIAITGFGAFEIAAMTEPRLTTIDVAAEEIGQRAGTLVRDLLTSETGDTPIFIDTPVKLISGGTS